LPARPEGRLSNDVTGFVSPLRTASSLPLTGLLTLGFDPTRFQAKPSALLPGILAATRTGLTPAGDDELTNTTNTMNYVTASSPVLLGARKRLTASSFISVNPAG
jgi:hypothetical protein